MIYLDMDGVLADFVQHTTNLGIPNNFQWFDPRETWTRKTWQGEKTKMDAMHSNGFWITMPVCPGALILWDAVPKSQRAVLTAKPHSMSPALVAWEKFAWINKNLGDLPYDRFVCCTRDEKMQYALGNILVDDDYRTCSSWRAAGGQAVHYDWAKDSKIENGSYVEVKWPNMDHILAELEEAINA